MAVGLRFWFISLPLLPILAMANANQPLDHPYTLRNSSPYLLEAEYHRMIESDKPRSYIFPRPCFSEVDSSHVCPELGGWGFKDSVRQRSMRLSPVVGYEYRYLNENVHAGDFGVITEGASGPVSFYLDARMYTEQHEDAQHASFDREFVERQDEEASGSFAYSSFSRYRSNLSYDWSWGRITVARDAVHWGPGLFTNLVFNQEAVPFNQLTFTTHLGPITVQSLYGQLAIDGNWETDTTNRSKTIYAHRYEWSASSNILLGVSEQLVLYSAKAPFAFTPIVPLFITKATEKEALNNGNISFDISWRLPGLGHLYSEFFIDDIQSPGSLLNDNWGNKWAWMAGSHWIKDWPEWKTGLITEFSRIEPWVYTHYSKNTSQSANMDYPLGNQAGPNSQNLKLRIYSRSEKSIYLSGTLDLLWKGTDLGSSLNDENRLALKKEFLSGVKSPQILLTPLLSYQLKWVTASLQGSFYDNTEIVLRVHAQY